MSWSSYFWVRSAGFPFERLEHLGVLTDGPALAQHAALHAELEHLDAQLTALARAHAPEALPKLERKLREGAVVAPAQLAEALRARAAPLLLARDRALAGMVVCLEALGGQFDGQLQLARTQLLDFLTTEQAREALFLSNPDALQRVDALVEQGIARVDSRTRQRLRLGWNYAQRLCSKNDTASFFGPIAWGRFAGPEQPSIDVDMCALPWLSSRKTFFEHWVVLRLALAIGADPRLRDSLPITLNAGCHVERGVLHYPAGKTKQLDDTAAALLGACCGHATRSTLLAQFDPAQALPLLEFFLSKTVLVAGFAIAPGAPLSQLQLAVAALDVADDVKSPWLALMSALEAQRIDFEVGDINQRSVALTAIGQLLGDAGVDLSRAHGKMYIGRFPLYEDCARNLHVELGGALEGELKNAMAPVMALYSWLVGAVAARMHAHYLGCWQPGADSVDFLRFLAGVGSTDAAECAIIADLRVLLANCWAQVTAAHASPDEVTLGANDMARLLQLLNAREPRASRFKVLGKQIHSPDFMIAAADVAAIERGQYKIVLGEVHPAVHTVSQPVAQPFCPYAEQIEAEVEQLLAPQTLVLADSPEAYQRSHIDWPDVPALLRVVLPKNGLSQSDLRSGCGEIYLSEGQLRYRDRQHGVEQDLLTLMPTAMHRICFALAGDVIGHSESRRLTFGRMVMKRQSWLIEAEHVPDSGEPGERMDDFLRWRRWAAQMGMPRHVFMKCASEPKPIYVDFCNPLALDLLASLAKKKEAMRFSEMRPAPDELWLADTRGRYCSEFRSSWVGTTVAATVAQHPDAVSAITE